MHTEVSGFGDVWLCLYVSLVVVIYFIEEQLLLSYLVRSNRSTVRIIILTLWLLQ